MYNFLTRNNEYTKRFPKNYKQNTKKGWAWHATIYYYITMYTGMGGFVEATLCTILLVQSYIVHHRPALDTIYRHCVCTPWGGPTFSRGTGHSQYFPFLGPLGYSFSGSQLHTNQGTLVVHNVALYWLGGAHEDFSCMLWTITYMVYNTKLSV